jgi:hypothetical protein
MGNVPGLLTLCAHLWIPDSPLRRAAARPCSLRAQRRAGQRQVPIHRDVSPAPNPPRILPPSRACHGVAEREAGLVTAKPKAKPDLLLTCSPVLLISRPSRALDFRILLGYTTLGLSPRADYGGIDHAAHVRAARLTDPDTAFSSASIRVICGFPIPHHFPHPKHAKPPPQTATHLSQRCQERRISKRTGFASHTSPSGMHQNAEMTKQNGFAV